MRSISFLFALFCAEALSEVIELSFKYPRKILANFEFGIINYVDDTEASAEASVIFQAAEKIYSSKSGRANTIGWSQLDIKKFPSLNTAP